MKKALPLTETTYYTLLALMEPNHGYGIIKFLKEATEGRILMGTGTLYTMLGRLTKDEWIEVEQELSDKKVYRITALGMETLKEEIERLEKQLQDGQNRLRGIGE